MAYYNANKVIKLTRKAMGITQEELCGGVCDVSTLSKIENGHYGVRSSVYRELMGRMGRMNEMRYATWINKDGRLPEDRLEWELALKRYDYAAAEPYLRKMLAEADDNILTRQYLARAEAMLEHYQERICAAELAQRIDQAIRMTVPDYERYLKQERVFPFFKEELLALISLGSAYRETGQKERGRQLYEEALRCLNANYIGDPDRTQIRITVKYNIAGAYAAEARHMEAMKEYDACLLLCRESDCGHLAAPLLAAKAHSCMCLAESGEKGKDYPDEAKKLLRQAYCLAAAGTEKELAEAVRQYYEQHLGKWD